ncbi:MAG: hypothetical protein LH614_03280 [Pyrinomonadaceae bacterium]|nr:hypothetical protein [Pyrinomonadaceae bacterium]
MLLFPDYHAASIAGLMLTTEAMIADVSEKDDHASGMGGMEMGMGMGM